MIRSGSVISSHAMLVLFFSPPLIPFIKCPPMNVSAHLVSLNSLISYSALDLIYSFDMQEHFRNALNSMLSRGVRVGIRISCCITYAEQLLKSLLSYFLPLLQIFPFTMCFLQSFYILIARIFNRDVFPAPDAPIRTFIYPSFNFPSIPLRMSY